MMKKTVQGLMALAVLCLAADAAHARDLTKDIQADVFVLAGASTLVDAQSWTAADHAYHTRSDLGLKYTVGVAVPFGKLLKIETAFTGGPNNLILTDTSLNPRHDIVYPVRFYSGSVTAVAHSPFAFMHFRPYGAAGVEYDRYSPTQSAMTTAKNLGFASVNTASINHNDKTGIVFGGGLDRKLTKRLTFRIDLRDHITGKPGFGLPLAATPDSNAYYPLYGRANNIIYTAGFMYHLGKL